MPDTPDVKAAIGRLSQRMDHMSERQDDHGERTEQGLNRVNERLDRIMDKLQLGEDERHDIARKVTRVEERLEAVEDTQRTSAVGAASHAATVAKRAVKDTLPDAVKDARVPMVRQKGFWGLVGFVGAVNLPSIIELLEKVPAVFRAVGRFAVFIAKGGQE